MKLIYLFFVLTLLVVAFAGYDEPRRKPKKNTDDDWEEEDYGYEDEEEEDDYYGHKKKMDYKPQKKLIPIGKKCCKCVKKLGKKCVKINCCQLYKIECKKYPVPTLKKP